MPKKQMIDELIDDITSQAPLKDTRKKASGNKIMIYGFDKEWQTIIVSHGAKVSSYAKIAIEEKLKKDGWL